MLSSIPPFPVSVQKAKNISKFFLPIANQLLPLFPLLKPQLKQSKYPIGPASFLSLTLFFSAVFGVAFTSFLAAVNPLVGITVGVIMFFVMIIYFVNYPSLLVKRRIMGIERNLIYGLKDMYVQSRAGIPLFDTMVSVSEEDYGELSEEFKEIVKKIHTGAPMEEVLDRVAAENPSPYFRRMMWQISNSLRSGAGISKTLQNTISGLNREQRIMIRRYGAQLNPMILIYLMVAVIVPALGVTMLIILSSFSGFPISEAIFWGILAATIVFQFMYLGMIKSRRPNV